MKKKHPKLKFISFDRIENDKVEQYFYYDVGPRTQNQWGRSVDNWEEFKSLLEANVNFSENVGARWRLSAGYLKRHVDFYFEGRAVRLSNNVGKKKLMRLVHKLLGKNVTFFKMTGRYYIEFKLTDVGDKVLEEL